MHCLIIRIVSLKRAGSGRRRPSPLAGIGRAISLRWDGEVSRAWRHCIGRLGTARTAPPLRLRGAHFMGPEVKPLLQLREAGRRDLGVQQARGEREVVDEVD